MLNASNVDDRSRARVTELLGREPGGSFEIVVQTADGDPLVLQNAPFMSDATPMPTLYWLLNGAISNRVGTLEANGGVRQAQEEIDADLIQATHARYQQQRDEIVSQSNPRDDQPRPTGGVGGTRIGVKCLHAHLAHYLATGDDVVGAWTAEQIALSPNEWRRVSDDGLGT